MCEASKPFQFTIGRLLSATAWFAATSAIVAIGVRNYAGAGDLLLYCAIGGILTIGLGVGALLGRPHDGFKTSAKLLWLLFVIYIMLLLVESGFR